jgi:hypothetical protein
MMVLILMIITSYTYYILVYDRLMEGDLFDYDSDSLFWLALVVNYSLLIVLALIFVTLILGVIGRAMGELKVVGLERCMICGTNKRDIEDWNYHTQYTHNLKAYLLFINNLQKKKLTDCNYIEKKIKV